MYVLAGGQQSCVRDALLAIVSVTAVIKLSINGRAQPIDFVWMKQEKMGIFPTLPAGLICSQKRPSPTHSPVFPVSPK